MTDNLVFPARPAVNATIAASAQVFPVHRIFCVGRNYHAHAAEMGDSIDKSRQEPFYFTKHPSALVASGSRVPYPLRTNDYQYEMELVVAIGRPGFNLDEASAGGLIFGYACGLDMTRRDLQALAKERRRPWDLGKDFEQSAVLSPIVPVARVGDIAQSRIQLAVNGEVHQDSDLGQMIWNVPEIIANLSSYYHLEAGDLIYTGTPHGVGPAQAGDELSGSIAGIGDIQLQIAGPE